MRRTTFFIVFLFKMQLLFAQVRDTSPIIDFHLHIDRVKERQMQIVILADSINNYMQGTPPMFLFDECFDAKASLWDNLHAPVSLRWKILEKVNNRRALKMILDNVDIRLDKKCSDERKKGIGFDIPMIDRSFRQLVKKRYRQLCTKP